MRRLGKKSKNSSKCTKRWSDHEVEHLIDLEESSCLWDVSNKDYYLRKDRERAHKQIEEKLGTERAVIKAKITSLRQQRWQMLRSFASANNSQRCWAQQCCDLLRPVAWALRYSMINDETKYKSKDHLFISKNKNNNGKL